MRIVLVAALFAGAVAIPGASRAADGCGPGCHSARYGECVVDGWERGAGVRNECPAGSKPRPPCGEGYAWRYGQCFPS